MESLKHFAQLHNKIYTLIKKTIFITRVIKDNTIALCINNGIIKTIKDLRWDVNL
jgi:hypothetical protein